MITENIINKLNISTELIEASTPIISLYPGKFKPPHAGHFDVVKQASKIADEVIVIISNLSKDEFTSEQSMKVWSLYKDLLPSNVKIKVSTESSPISEVFDIIKDKSRDFIVLYGKGERSRYISIENDREKYSNVQIVDAGNFENLNATDLRASIINKDLEKIQTFLPKGIDAKKIFSIYSKDEFTPGPLVHESFDKGLPNIKKLNAYEYKVGNGEDIEAIYYFNLEDPNNNWSVHWKFTKNNKNNSPEAWKQVVTTFYKILKNFLEDRHPNSILISGNTDSKTNIYKSQTIIDKLETLFNNEYKVDNSGDFSVVLRSIEEVAKPSIKKRMYNFNETYDQALNYFKNGDIFSQSKIERNNTLKKYNNRKQLHEVHNIPFKHNLILESFTKDKAPLIQKLVTFTCEHLGIKQPSIKLINSPTYTQEHSSFGGYIPSEQSIKVVVHNRNMADILRTLAHELVHHKQNLNGEELDGGDGSDTENEANATAGVIMRKFGRENPEIFESELNEVYFNTGKFSFPKPLSSHFIKAIHEVTLNSSNSVELNGSNTEGTFKVGDKIYEYNIKPFPNPYNDGGTFYNVGFNPIENKVNIPTKDTPSKDYLKILSTMYKIIMNFIEQNKPDYLGISSIDNPEGKDYHVIYTSLTDNKANRIPGYFRKDANLIFKTPTGSGRVIVMKKKQPTPPLDEIKEQVITCENCGWEWNFGDGGNDPYVCHKCGHDNTDEYDVENEQDLKEFTLFLKEYTQHLSEEIVTEAEYHGRKVQLGKPMQGDIKKFKVYVKNNKGKVVKVNFGFGGSSAKGKRMNIKVNNPKRRAAYRARHNCANPGPRDKANYWSCRKW